MNQPRSFILSYLPAATTATRIRKTATWGVLGGSLAYLTFAAWLVWIANPGFFSALIARRIPAFSIVEILFTPTGIFATLLTIAGLILLFCAVGVYKASRASEDVAEALLYPLFGLFCIISAMSISWPASMSPRDRMLGLAVGIPLFFIFLLLAVLALDLLSYLRWLGRRPAEEMPKRSFV